MLEGEIAFTAASKVTQANLHSLTEAIDQMRRTSRRDGTRANRTGCSTCASPS